VGGDGVVDEEAVGVDLLVADRCPGDDDVRGDRVGVAQAGGQRRVVLPSPQSPHCKDP
jgi:hypothetical protein